MAHERLTLDNPIFAQALRQPRRSVPAYQPRPTHPQTSQDMMFVRSHATMRSPRQEDRPPQPSNLPAPRVQRSQPPGRVSATAAATKEQKPVAQTSPKKSGHSLRKLAHTPVALYVLAGLLFAAGGYVAFTALRTEAHVKAQVTQLQKTADSEASDTPTAEKPSEAAIRNYTVAPALARYLDIPKLNVHARVVPLGIKSDNTLKAPRNGYDVGWYDASSRPGENGAMLIDGHSNVLGKNAVFAKLGKLVAGDSVKITRGDGTILTYRVRTVTTLDDDKVNMSQLLVSADTAKPGLNLITCAGDVIPGTLHLDKRTFVQAVLE